jgi:hypothetical protein
MNWAGYSFAGMATGQLATLAGALGAALVVLYILKLRRRRVVVPYSALWERVLRERETQTLFKRLRRLLSLLVQVAILVLILGALGDPRPRSQEQSGRDVVVVLDTSASMQATDVPGGRMKQALDQARKLVRGLARADRLMLVRMDGEVEPLTGFLSDEKELLRQLDTVKAADTPADVLRALSLSVDALRGGTTGPSAAAAAAPGSGRKPTLIILSDFAWPAEVHERIRWETPPPASAPPAVAAATATNATARPEDKATAKTAAATGAPAEQVDLSGIDVRALLIGPGGPTTGPQGTAAAARPVWRGDGENVGIVAFNVRRYLANRLDYEVFVEVENFGRQPQRRSLSLYADGELVDVRPVSLAPGQRLRLLPKLGSSGRRLEARLGPPASDRPAAGAAASAGTDRFALDDRAHALLPERRRVKLLLVSRGNLFLEGALFSNDNLWIDETRKYARISPAEWKPELARQYDVVVFDGVTPESGAELAGNFLYLAPPLPPAPGSEPPPGAPFAVERVEKRPFITETADSHAALRWVTLSDVNISQSAIFKLEPGDVALASSFRAPVIAARQRQVAGGTRRVVAFGFDLRRSDLPMRVAFPVMLINTVDWFLGEDSDLLATHRTGQVLTLPLQVTQADKVLVEDPRGQTRTVSIEDGRISFYARHVGLYQVRTQAKGPVVAQVAVNLASPAESRIATPTEAMLAGHKLAAPEGFVVVVKTELWASLLLVALGLSLVEWATYNRRVTV